MKKTNNALSKIIIVATELILKPLMRLFSAGVKSELLLCKGT